MKTINTKRKLFCCKPFRHLELYPAGDSSTCYWTAFKNTGSTGNLFGENGIDDAWNSEAVQKIRESILDNSFKYCNKERCPYYQGVYGPVVDITDMSTVEVTEWIHGGINAREVEYVKNNTTRLSAGPGLIMSSFDYTCNLKCPTCRTHVINWNDKHEMFEKIMTAVAPIMKTANQLFFGGQGDAFVSRCYKEWMKNVTADEIRDVQEIVFQTNALCATKNILNSVSQAVRDKVVMFDISIDATCADTYENYNRVGGNWELLLKNLDYIKDVSWINVVRLNFVVQNNNYKEMKDFVLMTQKYGFQMTQFIRYTNWGANSQEDCDERDIYLENHPNHQDFLEVLKDPIFDAEGVDLTNIDVYRKKALALNVESISI